MGTRSGSAFSTETISNEVKIICPCCEHGSAKAFREVDGYPYFTCTACDTIFIHPKVISEIDEGGSVVVYNEEYWQMELGAARERSREDSLARVAEVFYYARKPIKRFIDIGSGPGFLLDSLSKLLPSASEIFYGVELFPPAEELRTKHPNYCTGELGDLSVRFDAGCCIEVIEHLTPTMLRKLFRQLAERSNPGAIYIFNSAQPEFVREVDPGYIDAKRRGHIISYSLAAIERMAEPADLTVHKIEGKDYAFALEYKSDSEPGENIVDRIWKPCNENRALLADPEMGAVLRILGLEAVRGSV